MERFEKYHPIMTPRYTLDWLTMFSVKDVFKLRQNATNAFALRREVDHTITDTVHYISETQRLVMSNQQLTWGILERKFNTFIGIFQFSKFNSDNHNVEVSYELLPDFQHQGAMAEILSHMTRFAFDELGLEQLKAITFRDQNDSGELLKKVGFRVREDLSIFDNDAHVSPDKLVVYDMPKVVPMKR